MTLFSGILYGLTAAFFLLYYLPCALYWGWHGRELAAVLTAGLGSALLGIITLRTGLKLWTALIFIVYLSGLLVFLFTEARFLREMLRKEDGTPAPSWILIPGYRPRRGKAPRVLRERTERGARWLREHPEGQVILSGGFTEGELPEAEYMARLLEREGIGRERMTLESRSLTTAENMRFCREAAGTDIIGLVTNGFHMYRAGAEARKAGFVTVVPVRAGNGSPALLPYHLAREFLTYVSDKANGYL